MDSKDIMSIKKKLELKKAKRDEAKGKLEALKEQLQRDFGCTTEHEAMAKLKSLGKDIAKAEETESTLEKELLELTADL